MSPVPRHSTLILKAVTGSLFFYFSEIDCPAAAVPLSSGSNLPERLETQREMKKKCEQLPSKDEIQTCRLEKCFR